MHDARAICSLDSPMAGCAAMKKKPIPTDADLSGVPKFIRRAMPDASEAELIDARHRFREYVKIVVRSHLRRNTDQI